jgi:hypothetical protein
MDQEAWRLRLYLPLQLPSHLWLRRLPVFLHSSNFHPIPVG